ncbi:nucleotidyltransferase domain-containing protein [Pyrococcus kukulkanii]|uniref:nucleotidyltransferase domain-containing protein n=1 Tax=Pyrococcus kukulkanii TaxID=1609559 RepID=UPI00356ADD1C
MRTYTMTRKHLPLDCLRKRLSSLPIYSLILYGSVVRGDYIPGVSDVDVFVVLEEYDEKILLRVEEVVRECFADFKPVEVDVAWELVENLDDPLRKGYPYKFLTIYRQDFVENHIVVVGNDIMPPSYDFSALLQERIKSIESNLERFKNNGKMKHILAGEVVRLWAFLNGADLDKTSVLKKVEEVGDKEALEVYKKYLEGRKMEFSQEFLEEFIKRKLMEIQAILGNP